jgi:hypothetical protein
MNIYLSFWMKFIRWNPTSLAWDIGLFLLLLSNWIHGVPLTTHLKQQLCPAATDHALPYCCRRQVAAGLVLGWWILLQLSVAAAGCVVEGWLESWMVIRLCCCGSTLWMLLPPPICHPLVLSHCWRARREEEGKLGEKQGGTAGGGGLSSPSKCYQL